MTRSTTWRRRTPLRTRTRSRKRSDRRWNLREVNFSPFFNLYDYDKTKQDTPWAAKKHPKKITEKTFSDCYVSEILQSCTLARYVANHVPFHSPITMTKQKKDTGAPKKTKKNHRKKHFQCCTLARYVANHVSCHRNHHRELHCYDSHCNHCSQGNLHVFMSSQIVSCIVNKQKSLE